MRVLHVHRVTALGGTESHLLDLLENMRGLGIDAQLALLTRRDRPLPEYQSRLRERNIPYHAFTQFGHINPHVLWWLYRLIRRQRPQIVHTHLIDADLYGMLAARAAGVPVKIISRHAMNAFRRREPIRTMNRQLWRIADGGIAISHAVAEFLEQIERTAPRKINVIHYGLDREALPCETRTVLRHKLCSHLNIERDRPIVVMACRLIAVKGVSYALQAFAGVLEQLPQAYLVIAGDGVLRAQLEDEARKLIPGDNYRFLGWRDDVSQLLAACDLFMGPSLSEGLGLVYLEAMSQERPVVATDVSAINEVVVDGETGILVPPRDVPSLRNALLTLLHDPQLAGQMGVNGRRRLEGHFQIRRMVDQTVSLYEELLSGKGEDGIRRSTVHG